MDWKKNMDRARTIVTPMLPPRFIHWKTLLIASIVIWIISLIFFGVEILAGVGLVLLSISLGWRASQPPFVVGPFPLTPWLIATFISVLIYLETGETELGLALKAWPLIAAVLIVVMEWFKSRSPENSPPLVSRTNLVIIILFHVLVSCWVEIYILLVQQIEASPNIDPGINRPRNAFQHTPSSPPVANNYPRLQSDEQFREIF